jgi:peroxiredoxin
VAALNTGTTAPAFTLPTVEGPEFSLSEALHRGPVLLAFFKVSCPVCQFALPYLERIHQAYAQRGFTLIGVAQDSSQDALAFMRKFGVSFPVALDDRSTYPVSNAYGLTNVPTLFWIAPGGEIELTSVGWLRADLETLNREMAQLSSQSPRPLFLPDERVPDFKAG